MSSGRRDERPHRGRSASSAGRFAQARGSSPAPSGLPAPTTAVPLPSSPPTVSPSVAPAERAAVWLDAGDLNEARDATHGEWPSATLPALSGQFERVSSPDRTLATAGASSAIREAIRSAMGAHSAHSSTAPQGSPLDPTNSPNGRGRDRRHPPQSAFRTHPPARSTSISSTAVDSGIARRYSGERTPDR
jgi:hypothetical protein